MRLTSKGRYAVRAMLDLTASSNGNPVRLQEISTRQNISLHYLEQLFRKLRNGQTVKSVRGPGGGYVLARPQDQITIKDVLDCVGENINPAKDILGSESETANTVEYHLSKNYFQNLGIIMREYLQTTTLGDLMRKANETKALMEKEGVKLDENKEIGEIGDINVTAPQSDQEIAQSPEVHAPRKPFGEINQ